MSHHTAATTKEAPPFDLENGTGSDLRRQISVNLTAEQFEKLYLQPGGRSAKGNFAEKVGNPTLIGLASFLVCLTPASWIFMNFRGSNPASLAVLSGPFYFIAGMLEIIASIMEFAIGNSFPSVVFAAFGGFWIAFGYILDPSKGLVEAFTTATVAAGANPLYNSPLGLYLVGYGMLTFIFMLASLRTNVVFFVLFLTLDVGLFLLAGAYFRLVEGNAIAGKLLIVAGGFTFVTCLMGWYLFATIIFAVVGLPITLPVGDLSNKFQGKGRRMAS